MSVLVQFEKKQTGIVNGVGSRRQAPAARSLQPDVSKPEV